MKQRLYIKIIGVAFLLILFTSIQWGCYATTTIKYPIEVKKDGKNTPDFMDHEFILSITGVKYVISNKGKVECIDSKGNKTTFKLYEYSENEYIIYKLYYITYKNDLILLYNVDNEESGGGKITRIKISNNVILWDVWVRFLERNITEDKFLYFADRNGYSVSKFDLDSGKLIWQNKDLRKYTIKNVEKIAIKNSNIVLTVEIKGKSQLKIIKISKENGKEV